MRQITNSMMKDYQGSSLRIVKRDKRGNVVWEDEGQGRPVTTDASMAQALWALILGIPAQILTRQDAIHGTRLYGQISDHLFPDGPNEDMLSIEDAEYDWVMAKLGDDKVGVRIFGMNTIVIEEQLRGAVL